MIEVEQIDLSSDDSDKKLVRFQQIAADKFRKIGVFRDGSLELLAFFAIGPFEEFKTLRVAENTLVLLLGGYAHVIVESLDIVSLPREDDLAIVETYQCDECAKVFLFGYSSGFCVREGEVFELPSFPEYGVESLECFHYYVDVKVSRDVPGEGRGERWYV